MAKSGRTNNGKTAGTGGALVDPASLKRQLFIDFAEVGRAVGHPVRLEILDFLAQGEHSVEFLAGKCNQKVGNISQHLKILANAGLVRKTRAGNFICYQAVQPSVTRLVDALRTTAVETSPAVKSLIDSYFHGQDELTRREPKQLIAALRRNEVILLDVRPKEEFNSGHIKGAISIELKDLEQKIRDLPKHKEIIAYCRGPYCVLSVKAVGLLRDSGIKATRLPIGFPEWQLQNFPTE